MKKRLKKNINTAFKNKVKELSKTPPLIPRVKVDIPEPEIIERVRHSGHYTDMKLKYNKPESYQPSLFDSLLPDTKEKINDKEIETIVEGIKLSTAEDKLLNAILNILHKKSNTKVDNNNKPAEPDKFYKGNLPPEIVIYGGAQIDTPVLRFTPHEFFTEVTGHKNYSGEEIKYYNKAILNLSTKNYLIKYKRHRKIKTGNKTETAIDRVEEYQPLFRLIKYYEGLTIEEDEILDRKGNKLSNKRGEIIIKLNPLFIDQIDTKFILYPTDINKRTEIASGGSHKVTTAIIKLRDHLLRYLSNKIYTVVIDKKNIPYMLGLDTYLKESRKKLITQRIEESLQAVKNMNLVIEIKDKTGANYQPQYEFILNKNF